MKYVILTIVWIVALMFVWNGRYENGCMDGVTSAYLSEPHPKFNPDQVVSDHCFKNHEK